jgi:hypothetical protein
MESPMLEKMNLKTRLLTILSIVSFLSLAGVIAFLTINAQENVRNEAEARCLELADKQAAKLKGVLMVGLDAARNLRDSLVGIKKSSLLFDRRPKLTNELRLIEKGLKSLKWV